LNRETSEHDVVAKFWVLTILRSDRGDAPTDRLEH
jgi:hypothetical protein